MGTSWHGHRATMQVHTCDDQGHLTRQRLVRAARGVFESKGYSAARVGDITDASGVDRATFYLYFGNEAEALNAVLDDMLPGLAVHWRLLDAALLEGTPAAIRGWLQLAAGWWRDNAAVITAYQEAIVISPAVARRYQANLDTLSLELGRYLAGFQPPSRETARLRIKLLVIQLDQVQYRYGIQIRQGPGTGQDELLDLLSDIWCRTLQIG